MKKVIFLMLFAVVGWQHAHAQSFSVGGLVYNITSPTTVEVGNQEGQAAGNVDIPQSIFLVDPDGFITFSVTNIGDYAFNGCDNLTSVTIPNSVTSHIGAGTFLNCTYLTSVTFPNSLTSIGELAFSGCSSLTSLTIPNSLTSIGYSAFQGCLSLGSITIPNTVTSIGNDAFYDCFSLSSITIPNSLTSIGDFAFYGCSSLTSVICNNTTPLPINALVFYGLNLNTITLSVPAGSMAAYQATLVWQDFMFPLIIPTTKIKANQCGVTLATLDANINADYVAGYKKYRFEVSNGATVNTLDVDKYNFSLTQTPGITYSTTYGVRVAVNIGGVWGAYGASCNITTPALSSNTVLTTNVNPNFCGVTLAALDTKIPAKPIQDAQGYRFEVTSDNGTDNELTMIYNSATYNFKLAQSGTVLDYGKTYIIRVAALVNGIYGNYGAYCSVSTPVLATSSVPTTKIHSAYCGTTLAALDTKIPASPISGASGYSFEITTAGVTTVYESSVYNFKLSQTGVTVANGTTYTIRVAVLVNGIYGNFGASCDVTTPGFAPPPPPSGAAPRLKVKTFEVAAYPNPFDNAFNLNLETPSKEEVTISVYDMMGKLVETHQLNPTEVDNLQIGNHFAAGIYNVIVSQANDMQAIRLIRR